MVVRVVECAQAPHGVAGLRSQTMANTPIGAGWGDGQGRSAGAGGLRHPARSPLRHPADHFAQANLGGRARSSTLQQEAEIQVGRDRLQQQLADILV